MRMFLVAAGVVGICVGAIVFIGAPAITQEIWAVLAIGFGVLAIGLAGVIDRIEKLGAAASTDRTEAARGARVPLKPDGGKFYPGWDEYDPASRRDLPSAGS